MARQRPPIRVVAAAGSVADLDGDGFALEIGGGGGLGARGRGEGQQRQERSAGEEASQRHRDATFRVCLKRCYPSSRPAGSLMELVRVRPIDGCRGAARVRRETWFGAAFLAPWPGPRCRSPRCWRGTP